MTKCSNLGILNKAGYRIRFKNNYLILEFYWIVYLILILRIFKGLSLSFTCTFIKILDRNLSERYVIVLKYKSTPYKSLYGVGMDIEKHRETKKKFKFHSSTQTQIDLYGVDLSCRCNQMFDCNFAEWNPFNKFPHCR